MSTQSLASGSHQRVVVYLEDLNSRESIPNRIIQLLPPSFEVNIGRGSQTEPHLHPRESNAWFTSRVMSREHAILKLNPYLKRITLEDTGSMHGTYVDGVRLEQEQAVMIQPIQKVQFGAEIVRGDQIYNPLELSLRVDWNDSHFQSPIRGRPDMLQTSKNSFSIDYSDQEEDSGDDDVELIYESIRIPSPSSEQQSRTFSVPDTDDSESDLACVCGDESAPTSPTEMKEVETKKVVSLSIANNIESKSKERISKETGHTAGSSFQHALNVCDSEDELENEVEKTVKAIVEVIEADVDSNVSVYSDDEQDFSDDEVESHESELDQEPDDEEEQAPNNTHNQWESVPKLQVRNEVHPRRPSPSDCAMPKPAWYPAGNLPAIQSLVDHVPFPYVFGDNFPAASSSFPAFQPLQPLEYGGNVSWPNTDSNSGFQSAYGQGFNVPPLPSFQQSTPQNVRPLPFQDSVTQSNSQSLAVNQVEDCHLNKSSKVSINDIIEEVRQESPGAKNSRKRKANEIDDQLPTAESALHDKEEQSMVVEAIHHDVSDENAANSTNESDNMVEGQVSRQMLGVVPEKPSPSKKSVTFSPDTVVIESNSQRLRKKVKVHHEKQGNQFFKYVATAMAGAALGAVGTVFGLAALPADYFV